MHQPLIIQHLFQVSSLEDVSRERLEAFVETYPSYGVGHYLLSCKLKAEGSERFMPETQRTCLYFSNPLWLQWLLQNSDGTAADAPVGESVEPVTAIEQVTAEYVEPVAKEYVEPVAEPTPPVVEESVSPASESVASPIEEPNAEAAVENVVTMAEEAFVTPESLSTGEVEHLTAGEGENLSAAPFLDGEGSAAEQLLRSIEEARGLRETLQKFNEEAAPEPVTRETAPHEEPIQDEETPFVLDEPEEKPAVVEEISAAPEPQASAETPTASETHTAPEMQATPEPQVSAESATPTLAEPPAESQPAAESEAPKAATTVTQDFLFEPYHTIDYFASQGIKLTLDENPQDKLGKQLKSFTEWLKTMRRLPQKEREVVPDRVMEEAIQTSAAHSIQGKDVLTETMAEVLAKQGMREKARAVYEKLSLLNPDKRAYFAAKIEQLNIP